LAPETANFQVFHAISLALSQRRELRFRYKNLAARTAQARHVRPYHLTCIDNHWYLFAYDLGRQAIRTFALARLRAPQLIACRFAPPRHFDPDKYLRGSFAVLKGTDDYEVVIEFDAWATDLVRGRRWHASQTFVELSSSGSQLRMRLSSLEEIERWVLNWGTHATVLRPQALAKRLQMTAAELVRKYRN
jgi:proteasome accessory factor B